MPKKKIQLRRCGGCNSIGHNKATCPNKKKTPPPAAKNGPVKFFVHHVSGQPLSSPHVVNLKKESSAAQWKDVESVSPNSPDDLYFSYHNNSTASSPNSPLEGGRGMLAKDSDDTNFEFPETSFRPQQFKPARPKKLRPVKISDRKLATINLRLSSEDTDTASDDFQPTLNARAIKLGVFSVLAALLILIAPKSVLGYYQSLNSTKQIITDNSTAGFLALQESSVALRSANFDDAATANTSAISKFEIALGELETKHTILQNIVNLIPYVSGEIQSREKVLFAGQEIALGNSALLAALENIKSSPSSTLTAKLDVVFSALQSANPNYQQALANLNGVDAKTLPPEYQGKFKDFLAIFTDLAHDFKTIANLKSSVQEIFGGLGERQYMLVFQNPAELRPTGGFMGTFATLDVKDGKIEKLTVPPGGTYDLQGQLPDYLIPPLPLTLSNKRWEFQDANWYPDFPASAQKMLWFYHRSRGVQLDGVIAINATVLERILGIIGPLSLDSRNLTLASDDALATIQSIVETGPEKKLNKPKQIISDLAPQILSRLLSVKEGLFLPLLQNFSSALEEKEIQAYFTDVSSEKAIKSFGWSGEILTTDPSSDYLSVINTNIQGQKSDSKINQTISHQAIVDETGAITDTVIITREHTGAAGEKLYGEPNVDYLRIYVPDGSTLIAAEGFSWPDDKSFRAPDPWSLPDHDLTQKEIELGTDPSSGTRITKEFDKTAFGNWVITEPGQTSRVAFTYRLPFKTSPSEATSFWNKTIPTELLKYQLVVQKQSGITSDFDHQVIFPGVARPVWGSGDNFILATNGGSTTLPLTHDEIFSILMKQPK